MDSIPLALRGLVKRLESVPDLSRKDLISIIFVVRIGDGLHRGFYGTFLTLSLVEKLCEKLEIPDLILEIEVFKTRWNFRQGTVAVVHRIGFDYDMEHVGYLSKIGLSVIEGNLSAKEGLRLIRDFENRVNQPWTGTLATKIEWWYREFPGRGLVIPLMGASCATVYFDGTWYDFGFAAISGFIGGIVAWAGAWNDHLLGIMDYLAAIFTAMVAVASLESFPNGACFSAQVLGTLYWFLYGTAFVISLYEITNSQVVTGVTRFVLATVKSYGLAFGVILGVWFSAYNEERSEQMSAPCSEKTNQIDNLWYILLFPLSAVACLMQFRVKLKDWFICLIVQTIAYGSQYLIGQVWKQPGFFANLVPAFLATIASHICIVVTHWLKLTSFNVNKDAYLAKKTDGDDILQSLSTEAAVATPVVDEDGDILEEASQTDALTDSDKINYVNTGWAERNNNVGYTRADKLTYGRSDLWFCLLPALYLLVPGSKLLQTAFIQLLTVFDDGKTDALNSLSSSLFLIGLGQVVGLRLGFVTIWACLGLWSWVVERRCGRQPQ